MTIAYFNLTTKKYLPNTATSFAQALQFSGVDGTLANITDDTCRIRRRSNNKLTNIELRVVTLTSTYNEQTRLNELTVSFRNETPVRF